METERLPRASYSSGRGKDLSAEYAGDRAGKGALDGLTAAELASHIRPDALLSPRTTEGKENDKVAEDNYSQKEAPPTRENSTASS